MTCNDTLRDLLPRYRRYLDSLRLAKGTVDRYLYEAISFTEYSWRHHRIWPTTIRTGDVEAWEQTLVKSGRYRMTSIVARMRGLRAFFSYMVESGILRNDPFVGLPQPALPAVLPHDILTPTEAMLLVESAGEGSAHAERDRLAIQILYATGLRVAELCNLDIADVDFADGVVRVRDGKGGKDRTVPLGNRTLIVIRAYLRQRSADANGKAPLLLSSRGKRLGTCAVQAMVRRACATLGIDKHVTPHTLRHTCATHMHARGAGIFHIKEMLGHEDITTTQIYTRVAPREAKETHRSKHPRERYVRRVLGCGGVLPIAVMVPPHRFPASCGRQGGEDRGASAHARRTPYPAYGDIPQDGFVSPGFRYWLDAYRDHLRLLNRGERTIRTHVARLLTFLRFAADRAVNSPAGASRALILEYREHLAASIRHRRSRSAAAVQNQFLAVVLCFFRFLAYREVLPQDPAAGIRYAREPHHLPRGLLSRQSLRRILEQPDIHTSSGLRDRAILEVRRFRVLCG